MPAAYQAPVPSLKMAGFSMGILVSGGHRTESCLLSWDWALVGGPRMGAR